jgi:DNA-binding LacI/PurR family transcriptional regulator
VKLTINEIAELAQVAKSTVSKALNGHKGVSEDKRRQIVKLARQLDYHPNASAQALASSRSGFIGFVLPAQARVSLAGAYWSAVISAAAQEARSRNYNLLILSPGPDDDISRPVDSVLKRRSVDGLILGAELVDAGTVSSLVYEGLPFVLVGRNPTLRHYSVDVDNEAASRRIVAHLAGRGRRRIACLAGPPERPYVLERIAGYRAALADAGLDWSVVEYAPYDDEKAGDAAARLLGVRPELDALFITAGGDFFLSAIDALRRLRGDLSGLDLSVFDDYRFFDYLGLPISRVRQPLGELGAKAASLLFELIEGIVPERMEWVLESEAVLR